MPTTRSIRRNRAQQERDGAQPQLQTPASTSTTSNSGPVDGRKPVKIKAALRQTRAMKGNGQQPSSLHTRPYVPLPNKAVLQSFQYVAVRDQTVVTSGGRDANDPEWMVVLYFNQRDTNQMVIEAEDHNGRVVARAIFPHARYKVEVRLITSTYKIIVEQYDERRLVASFTFQVNAPGDTTRARNLWNRVNGILKNMPHDVLRYVNIPRPLPMIRSKIGEYNLRNRRVRVERRVESVVMTLPNTTYRFEWTNVVASPHFQELCHRIRGGRPGDFKAILEDEEVIVSGLPTTSTSTSASTATATTVITTTATTAAAAAATRPIVVHGGTVAERGMISTCAVCKQGEVPLGGSNIARRRYRQVWIGCQKSVECRSVGMWFHIDRPGIPEADQCSGVTSAHLGKYGRWWCPLCRVSINGLNEFGIIRPQ